MAIINFMKSGQQGFFHPVLIVVLALVIGVIGFGGYRIIKSHQASTPPSPVGTPKTLLRIASEPSGVQMESAPLCNSTRAHQGAPFVCTATDKSFDTVIKAPAQTSINGKAYTFTTWDGCSASNADKTICRVTVKKDQAQAIKATYAPSSSAQVSSTPSNSTPTAQTNTSTTQNESAAPTTNPTPSETAAPSANPTPSPSPTPQVNDRTGTFADNQCANSLSIDHDKNVATCSIAILGYSIGPEVLELGMAWSASSSTKQPPITATCSHAVNNSNCTLFKKNQSSALLLNQPTVVNSDQDLGGPNPGPTIPTTGIFSSVDPTTVTFSFPYLYSSNGKNFRFTGFREYNNTYHKHPPLNYYVNWNYEALN